MKKVCCIGLIVAMALVGCSSVLPQRTPEFEQADSNRDGGVTLSEWLRFGGAEVSFIAADAERDGVLDESQFRQGLRLNDEASGGANVRKQKVMDSQVRADIQKALEQSRDINAWNVKVEVYQGNVTLSGPVRTAKEKQVVEQIASKIMGVETVFNQIVIKQ